MSSPQDTDAVIAFLSGDRWPFHVSSAPTADRVRQLIAEGYIDGPGTSSFWVSDDDDRVGLIRLEDLGDPTPLFDLRISSDHRGRGNGAASLDWLTRHLFDTLLHVTRIEAQTRIDNAAMRQLLLRAGYVKEAHYRQAWPGADRVHDSIGYALLRNDWENGTSTPVRWET